MQESSKEQEAFSVVKRAKSFAHAIRGVEVMLKTQHNTWIHITMMILVLVLGFYFRITSTEWIAIVFSIGLVFVTESINTAIEFDIDLTSPEFHPFARDTKDVAAGAVLLSAMTALVVGGIIFVPKLFPCIAGLF